MTDFARSSVSSAQLSCRSSSRCYGGGGRDANPEKHASSAEAESTQRVSDRTSARKRQIRGCPAAAAAAYTSVPTRASNPSQITPAMSLPLPGLLRPWQPDPKVSLTVASSLVAETNLGFAGLALVGHKGRSGASSVASCGQCSATLYPCHAEGSHTQATSGGAAGRKRFCCCCCSEGVRWQKIRLCTSPVPGVQGSFGGRLAPSTMHSFCLLILS